MPMWNAITVARACRAGLAGLALVILSASLAGAVFGPRTTIGKNYQQWSNTESANGINQGQCVNTKGCYVLFQRIPQQQPLIVQHVSCVTRFSDAVPHLVVIQALNGQTQVLGSTHLLPVFTSTDTWVVNGPAMHLLKSGERPRILFVSSDATDWIAVECIISGRLQ